MSYSVRHASATTKAALLALTIAAVGFGGVLVAIVTQL